MGLITSPFPIFISLFSLLFSLSLLSSFLLSFLRFHILLYVYHLFPPYSIFLLLFLFCFHFPSSFFFFYIFLIFLSQFHPLSLLLSIFLLPPSFPPPFLLPHPLPFPSSLSPYPLPFPFLSSSIPPSSPPSPSFSLLSRYKFNRYAPTSINKFEIRGFFSRDRDRFQGCQPKQRQLYLGLPRDRNRGGRGGGGVGRRFKGQKAGSKIGNTAGVFCGETERGLPTCECWESGLPTAEFVSSESVKFGWHILLFSLGLAVY